MRASRYGGDNTPSLLMQPLWLMSPPQYVLDDWRNLSARLLARPDDRWDVWIDWYEARLAGCVDLSERIEIARISLPNEVWAQGAACANASISSIVAYDFAQTIAISPKQAESVVTNSSASAILVVQASKLALRSNVGGSQRRQTCSK